MKKVHSMTAFITAAALAGGVSLTAAQDPAPQTPQPPAPQAPAPASPSGRTDSATADKKFMRGELVKVDIDAKTITLKHMNGALQTFRYTDATEIDDRQSGIAGLATRTGSKVRVIFTGEGEARVATKIEADEQ